VQRHLLCGDRGDERLERVGCEGRTEARHEPHRFGEDGIDPSRSVQGRAVDIDDILQEVLGEEPSWKERLREQEMASYGLTEKDMYVEITEEEVEVEEEEPPSEE